MFRLHGEPDRAAVPPGHAVELLVRQWSTRQERAARCFGLRASSADVASARTHDGTAAPLLPHMRDPSHRSPQREKCRSGAARHLARARNGDQRKINGWHGADAYDIDDGGVQRTYRSGPFGARDKR